MRIPFCSLVETCLPDLDLDFLEVRRVVTLFPLFLSFLVPFNCSRVAAFGHRKSDRHSFCSHSSGKVSEVS